MKVHVWKSGTYTAVGLGLDIVGYSFLSPGDAYDPQMGIAIALLNARAIQGDEVTDKWLKSLDKNGIVHTTYEVDGPVAGVILDVIRKHAVAQARNKQRRIDHDKLIYFALDNGVDFEIIYDLLTEPVGYSEWAIKEAYAKRLNEVANHYTKIWRNLA
jgi:hypothetical protein